MLKPMIRAALLAAACGMSVPAFAQADEVKNVDVPAGELTTALEALARQAGVELVYQSDLVRGIHTEGVAGEMSARDAVVKLLDGTPLILKQDVSGAILIAPPIATPISSDGSTGSIAPRGGAGAGMASHAMDGDISRMAQLHQQSDFPGRQAEAEPPPSSTAATDTTGQHGARLEEVVVTARHREESMQTMGMAISAYSGDILERTDVSDFSEIVLRSPGLDTTDRGPNKNDISFRGVASSSYNNDYTRINPVVGVFLDGVPVATPFNSQRAWNLFDLARVEIVRGPQGTLYGEGAMGGSVRYVTNDPVFNEFEGKLKTSFSSTDGSSDINQDYNATVNLPIVDDHFATRVTGFYRRDEGFIDYPVAGVKDANTFENSGVRLVALAGISDAMQVRLSATYENSKSGTDWIATDDVSSLESVNPLLEPIDDDALVLSGQFSYEFAHGTFTSITGYLDREQDERGYEWIVTASFGGLISTKSYVLTNEQFTQEFRYASNLGGPVNFLVGAYYKKLDSVQDLLVWTDIGEPEPTEAIDQEEFYTGKQYSGFGELSYDVTEDLRINAGVRYFREDVEATQVWRTTPLITFPPTNTRTIDLPIREWLPKFGVEYSPRDNWLLYGSAGRGARNGSTNDTALLVLLEGAGFDTTDIATYGPDSAWSYEAGFKGLTLQNRLTSNLAIYFVDWSDVQGLVLTPPLALLGGLQFPAIQNLDEAESKGAELFLEYQATDAFSVFFSGNVTDAEISKDVLYDPSTGNVIPKGSRIPMVAEYTMSIGGEYAHPIGGIGAQGAVLVARVDCQFVGNRKAAFDIEGSPPSAEVPSFKLLNLGLGLEAGRWSVNIFAKNVLNEVVPFYQDAPVVGMPTQFYIGQPRTIGLSASIDF